MANFLSNHNAMTHPNLQEPVQKFLRYLQQERQFSPHTLSSYKTDLFDIIQFVVPLQMTRWDDIQEKTIRAFLVAKRSNGNSTRSLNRQLSALKSFYRYLIREKCVVDQQVLSMTSLKTNRSLPKALDVDQMAKLLEISPTKPLIIRDVALIELLYSAGLRVSEIVSLNVQDLDLPQHQATVLGKGKKTRLALIGQAAMKALTHWLSIRSTLAKSEETALFVNKAGTRLSTRAVQYRLLALGIQQGIESRVSPHRLRHSFASHLLESSQDLRSVQELLGHSDLNTTQIYTKINFQHLAHVYDECHPRAHKQTKDPKP